jgi:hypothetical protein
MLQPPPHLLESAAQTSEIHFAWDDWDTEAVEERPDDALVGVLQRLSDRAIVALTTAMAEWIVFRFEPLTRDRRPWQYLEAAWAAGADWRYCSGTWESVAAEEEWQGPVRGTLGATMMGLDEVLYAARLGEDLTDGARWVSNIALHVLPHPDRFRTWRDRALQRLAALYPRNGDEPIGDPVPREALDLTREFNAAETEALVNLFLRSVDYRANPFLAAPAELVEAGFTGTPYVFDLSRDREERLFH